MRSIVLSLTLLAALGASERVAHAAPLFDDQGTGALGTQACGGSGCWTNYARIADMNGDGKLDLVFVNCSGFFASPGAQPLVVYENDGAGHFTNASTMAWGDYASRIRQVAIGDVDGDGDPDLFAPDAGGQPDALFINQGSGTYVDEAAARIGTSSHAGATRFADVDDDGDLDLFVADGYATTGRLAHLYLNDGTGHFTEAAAGATPTTMGSDVDDFDVLDVDGDFDLDLLINVHAQNDALWINDGAGHFVDASPNLPSTSAGLHYDPGVCDVDGDGDLDLVIDNTGPSYTEQLLLNDGTGHYTDHTAQIVGNVPNADDNGIACVDYDGDGDMDLVVAALSTSGERLFQNDGTGHFTAVPGAFTPIVDPTLWIDFGDLDGDGRLDAMTAQGESSPQLERVYLGNAGLPVDVAPPKILAQSATQATAAEQRVRFRVSDDAVTDDGPRLRSAWIEVGGTKLVATFVGGDVFRAVVPAGAAAAGATITACAEDLRGNVTAGCSVPATSSATTSSSLSATSATSTGASAASTSGSTSGGGGAGGGGGGSGCGCRVGDEEGSLGGALALAAVGVLALGGRARRRGPRARSRPF